MPTMIDGAVWVNRSNPPEKLTAKPTKVRASAKHSIGGKGVHMTAPGIKAMLKAPKPHTDMPISAPLGPKPKRKKTPGVLLHPPIPTMCTTCGSWFGSRNERGRHQRQQDDPVLVRLDQLGIEPGHSRPIDILICAGGSEMEIAETISRKYGFDIGPETKVHIDPRMKQ